MTDELADQLAAQRKDEPEQCLVARLMAEQPPEVQQTLTKAMLDPLRYSAPMINAALHAVGVSVSISLLRDHRRALLGKKGSRCVCRMI